MSMGNMKTNIKIIILMDNFMKHLIMSMMKKKENIKTTMKMDILLNYVTMLKVSDKIKIDLFILCKNGSLYLM